MNQGELLERAMDLTLHHFEDNFVTRCLTDMLKDAGGDIAGALELFKRFSMRESFGNWGAYLQDVVVECHGAAPRANIEAWDMARGTWTDRDPDLVITWRDVLAYVKTGQAAVQLELFA